MTGEVRLDGRKTTSSSPAETAIDRAGRLRPHLRPSWIATQAPMGGPARTARASGECRFSRTPVVHRPSGFSFKMDVLRTALALQER
jgi:hypothetical protein